MSQTTARPRRYVDLVHELDEKRRSPVITGCWVVVSTDEDLTGYAGISLAKVVEGPTYTHVDGHCVQAVWRLHDGREIPQLRLTAVEISELLESATDALRWLRNGVHPDRILPEMLRAHRAGSLARRTLEADGDPGISRLSEDDRCALRAMVSVSGAISELEISWREMVRSRLPNLVRSLWLAGALEISRRGGMGISSAVWYPNTEGWPHPLVAGLAPADLAAIGWRVAGDPAEERVDCAKPDRWLVRLAEAEGETVDALCARLAAATGDRVATVDVVLWRACAIGALLVEDNNIRKGTP